MFKGGAGLLLDEVGRRFILPGVFFQLILFSPGLSSLLFSAAAGLATLLGGFLVTAAGSRYRGSVKYFMAVGAGFLLSLVFLEIVPQTLQAVGKTFALWFLGGYLTIHLVEHSWTEHFHFGEEVHKEEISRTSQAASLGLLVHSFLDGVSISAAYHFSSAVGALMFVAIGLHKLPEGFTVASLNLAAGSSEKTALRWAGFLGLATLAGGCLSPFVYAFSPQLLAFSGGVALYVAASDLVPEVNRERGAKMPILVFVGVLLFYLTEWLLHHLLEG